MSFAISSRLIWVVGDATRPEFAPAVDWLSQVARVTRLSTLPDDATPNPTTEVGIAKRDALPAEFPDWIVLLAGRPGEFSQSAVRRLQTMRPLARPIGLLGSWCEGEPRSGQPWPGVARVLWHQWEPRWKRQWQLLTTGRVGNWALPRTTLLFEELLFDLPARAVTAPAGTPTATPAGAVAIHAGPVANREALADGCRAGGFVVVPLPQSSTTTNSASNEVVRPAIDVAIWDAPGWQPDEWDGLASFTAQVAPTPTLAIVSAPRYEDIEAAHRHGAAAVLGKPFQIQDLWWWLDELRRAPRPLVERAAAGV